MKKTANNSEQYWISRYNDGGNSGLGSVGALLKFKADFINDFIRENDIHTVTDFGHGDLALANLFVGARYTGIDIFDAGSRNVNGLTLVKSRFDQYNGESTDLVTCIDVLYHIIRGEQDYLFASIDKMIEVANKFVIIYAQDSRIPNNMANHMWNGPWLQYILENKHVELVYEQQNPISGTTAKFFVFKKVADELEG